MSDPLYPELPEMLTEKQAAACLGLLPCALEKWRVRRDFRLPWVKLNGENKSGRATIRYLKRDVIAFIFANRTAG